MRRRRKPLTPGLNKNHNRVLKDVFNSMVTASIGRAGPFQDQHGLHTACARTWPGLILGRKFVAVTPRLWKQEDSTMRQS